MIDSPARVVHASAIDPDVLLQGVILIAAPHFDDEALACGGTIARIRDKARIHLIYATDGTKSPEPVLPWRDTVCPDLGAIRRRESVTAMTQLGVPAANLHFLNLPEARLEHHRQRLFTALKKMIARIQPDHVLTPFRFDRHRDHVAVNDAVTSLAGRAGAPPLVWEYFVYHRWRLLPRGDIRAYIGPENLYRVDIATVSSAKRAALDCFATQTTRYFHWQSRPNLTPALLDTVSREPEVFVRYDPARTAAGIFDGSIAWIRIAHRFESPLKRRKDRLVALWRRTRAQFA